MALVKGLLMLLVVPAASLLGVGIVAIVYNVARWARFRADAIKVEWLREAVQGAIADGTAALGRIVKDLQTEFVDEWKRASADGKLTEEEKAKLKALVMERLNKTVPEAILQVLKDNVPDFEAWVESTVNAWVQDLKMARGEVGAAVSIPLMVASDESGLAPSKA